MLRVRTTDLDAAKPEPSLYRKITLLPERRQTNESMKRPLDPIAVHIGVVVSFGEVYGVIHPHTGSGRPDTVCVQ